MINRPRLAALEKDEYDTPRMPGFDSSKLQIHRHSNEIKHLAA